MVLLTDEQLTITFGRWTLSTTPSNVVDATFTGPYTWWKVAGPAHLSVADRGVTFATTTARGVCLTFAEPVAAIDPLGVIRHPAATVTVADPEGFRDAVLAARGTSRRSAGPRPPHEPDGPRQGTYRGTAAALARWAGRGDRLRHERRDVERIEPPEPSQGSDDAAQRFDDGVGAAFHRRYTVAIDGADTDAASAMARIQADWNGVCNQSLSPVTKVAGDLDTMAVGDRYVVALAGPWSGPVEVVEVAADRFRLATLEGHLEAGMIEFRMTDLGVGALRFTIESWARNGGRGMQLVYDGFGLAQRIQAEMWVEMCEAVVELVHGAPRGPVEVLTERAAPAGGRRDAAEAV
jgi:hypothetical protein